MINLYNVHMFTFVWILYTIVIGNNNYVKHGTRCFQFHVLVFNVYFLLKTIHENVDKKLVNDTC